MQENEFISVISLTILYLTALLTIKHRAVNEKETLPCVNRLFSPAMSPNQSQGSTFSKLCRNDMIYKNCIVAVLFAFYLFKPSSLFTA